jgi:membrane fusion protein (multidrug efflux system)
MKRPAILAVVVIVAVLATIGAIKALQIRAAIARSEFRPPPIAVTTATATLQPWPTMLRAVGSVVAVQGVTVSADLPGIVDAIAFESGETVDEGDLLVALDSRQELAQRRAAVAERSLAASKLARAGPLREQGVISVDEHEGLVAEAQRTAARIAEIDAILARKRIRAPFGGTLGIREVDLGQVLAAGDPVVSLESIDPIFVRFTVPQRDFARLRIGSEVSVATEAEPVIEKVGAITAMDAALDEATRNLRVQATFDNDEGALRPGMFVEARVQLGAPRELVTLPATAIHHAPYGDSVFVVVDMVDAEGVGYRGVRQQFVRLGDTRGDQVAIRSGVEAGDEVVSSGVFRLRPGAAVQVDNTVRPSNQADPSPENR